MSAPSAVVCGVRVGNRAVDPAQPWSCDVVEPATGQALAQVAGGGADDARLAADTAASALAGWSSTAATVRASALRRIAAALRRESVVDELAMLTTRETGKRLAEARAEVGLSAVYFDWFADAVCATPGQGWNVVPGVHHEVHRRPVGVVAVSTPWNFPLSIPARKLAPALAAGCSVVFKPSEIAPLSSLRIAEIVEEQLPTGVANTVVGDAATVTTAWLEHPAVRALTFTGSVRVGRLLAAQAAARMTRCVFELGGSAPFVLLDDADIARAVELLMVAKYRNNGQSCIAANRVWAPRVMLEEFAAAFLAASNDLVLGDPREADTTLGAMALPGDADRIEELLGAGEAAGARIERATMPLPAHGQFARPAVCIEPPATARIATEEIFGPAVSISGYDSIDEVLVATRENPLGLAGYVVGRDEHRATDVARALDVGLVGVNNPAPNTPQIPFAGLKLSGIGAEGGFAGLEAFRTDQSIGIAR